MVISRFGRLNAGRTIGLVGAGLLLVATLAPTIYATEDGQFPVFPTVIGDASESGSSTATTSTGETKTVIKKKTVTQVEKKTVVQEEESDEGVKSRYVTNESGVFSPWGTVKQRLFNRAEAGEGGVVFALTSPDAKPTSQGDFHYQIFYANNTADTLRNVTIQVFLPKDVVYLDSDVRPTAKGDGAVVFDIGKIAAGEQGAVQLETRLKKKNAKEVIVKATMNYEDIDGGAHSVTATANNSFGGKNGNGGLSASVLDGAGGIMLWLFVIILIIALAFVAYQLFVLRASERRV